VSPEEEHTATDEDAGTTTEEDRDASLIRALDFIESCLAPFGDAENEPSATVDVPEEWPAVPYPKHTAWRIPRGFLYWLIVGAAAVIAWRLTESITRAAIAALLASAIVMMLEIVLRMVDPRIARRLGLARGRSGAVLFGASAFLGVAAGIAIAYLV
jgi:hypothetical protein